MRNRNTRGYTGYRGRRGNRKGWLVAVLLLTILAAAAFLFAQRYRIYHSDGSSRYELPWARKTKPSGETQNGLELVIENADGTQTTVTGG